jgi:hypothetical protein
VAPLTTRPSPTIRLKYPHPEQLRFITNTSPRKIIRAGRRSGKTTGLAIYAVQEFLRGARVLYAVPTGDQALRFWHEVTLALAEPIDAGIFRKNETLHIIELPGTEQRIRAKTAWNSETLRGDYSNRLILDEWQLCNEDAWALVGAPMMLDRDGSVATFCYTPPSLRTAGISKAHDPRHAAKMFQAAEADTTGRWSAFHFTSHANPHLSRQALSDITQDMSVVAHRQEILAEDLVDVPGALWTQRLLDETRVTEGQVPDLVRIVVALDPAATSQETSDEMGIIAAGTDRQGHGYTLHDASRRGTPAACARAAIALYDRLQADLLVGEVNNGGEWIGTVIQFVAAEMFRAGERTTASVPYKMLHASRGKQTRAQPVATEFEHHRLHHVGVFPALEIEQTTWVPGDNSPSRMDAEVWAYTELLLHEPKRAGTWGTR